MRWENVFPCFDMYWSFKLKMFFLLFLNMFNCCLKSAANIRKKFVHFLKIHMELLLEKNGPKHIVLDDNFLFLHYIKPSTKDRVDTNLLALKGERKLIGTWANSVLEDSNVTAFHQLSSLLLLRNIYVITLMCVGPE